MNRKFFSFAAVLSALLGLGLLSACHRSDVSGVRDGARPLPTQGPARKPGLWKQTILIEPGGIQTSLLCLDQAADAQISWWGNQGIRSACTTNEVKRQANGGWTFWSVCPGPNDIKTTTTGHVVGDFNARYQMKAEVTTVNSPAPELGGTRTVTIDAEWQGECPSEMRPGDVELANGQRANLIELTAPPPK